MNQVFHYLNVAMTRDTCSISILFCFSFSIFVFSLLCACIVLLLFSVLKSCVYEYWEHADTHIHIRYCIWMLFLITVIQLFFFFTVNEHIVRMMRTEYATHTRQLSIPFRIFNSVFLPRFFSPSVSLSLFCCMYMCVCVDAKCKIHIMKETNSVKRDYFFACMKWMEAKRDIFINKPWIAYSWSFHINGYGGRDEKIKQQ